MSKKSYVIVDGGLVTINGKPLEVPISDGGGTDLAAVDVYIADFTDSTELSISAGAVDKYTRTIVS